MTFYEGINDLLNNADAIVLDMIALLTIHKLD